MNTLKIPNG